MQINFEQSQSDEDINSTDTERRGARGPGFRGKFGVEERTCGGKRAKMLAKERLFSSLKNLRAGFGERAALTKFLLAVGPYTDFGNCAAEKERNWSNSMRAELNSRLFEISV